MNDLTSSAVSNDSRNTAVLMFILSIFFWFLPALIMFLVKKEDAFVYRHAIELLNFAITLAIVSFVLMFIPFLGWLAIGVIGIAALVLLILGTLKVKEGENYTFPFTLRLLK